MKIDIQRFGKPYEAGKERQKKRNALFGVLIFLFFAIVIVSCVAINIDAYIRGYVVLGLEEIWAASVPSYWGGIIGGMVSGIFAFLGVFYTIRYYKESDAQKERAAEQPFLLTELVKDPKYEIRSGFSLGKIIGDKEEQKTINVSVKNIGKGFAKTLVIYTGINIGGVEFSKVITVGDCVYTFFVLSRDNLKNGASFAIHYVDSMTNEYIQEYTIKEEYNSINIECGYPQLLEQ